MVLTLNNAAFARLLAYIGLDGDLLIKAIPSLAPRTRSPSGEPPAIRLSFAKARAADCPGCRLRRTALMPTRVCSQPRQRVCATNTSSTARRRAAGEPAAFPEVAGAQRRLDRITPRRGPSAAMRAYEVASGYRQRLPPALLAD